MSWTALLREAASYVPPPIRAYSEVVPPPYVGVKPYGEVDDSIRDGDDGWIIPEHEEEDELAPAMQRIAETVLDEFDALVAGRPTRISRFLTDGNPAWPAELAAARRPQGWLALPLVFSKTQDDKGRVSWTLFGTSDLPIERLLPPNREFRSLAWTSEGGGPYQVALAPFERLGADERRRFLNGSVTLLPSPASLLFTHHPGFARLSERMPHARQIPLLALFPRSERSLGVRIPPSGWLDEKAPVRRHRWERTPRDADATDGLDDAVTRVLFSTEPDRMGLYGKPMARNVQVWSESFDPVLDGPRATPDDIAAAELRLRAGGRYGYRYFYAPMQVGPRCVFWHRLLLARRWHDGHVQVLEGFDGVVTAERDGAEPLMLRPVIRPEPLLAMAREFLPQRVARENVRKLSEWRGLMGPLSPSFAARLLTASKGMTVEAWLRSLPEQSTTPDVTVMIAGRIAEFMGREEDPGPPLTLRATATRDFEERYWHAIRTLSSVERRNNADDPCQLNDVAARLRAHYADLGLEVEEHRFKAETDFRFPWTGVEAVNVIAKIPGRDRREAVILADHFDAAFMEDLYREKRRVAAAGADDNCSGTATLMLAAGVLKDLQPARDIWLVHLTGEEFPADCLGARMLAHRLLRESTRIRGAFVLDMIAHNHDRDLFTFQIAPGEGRASARLAWHAHAATHRWNRSPRREGSRATRGESLPPPAAQPFMHGDVRSEWEPRSTLYNTDAQIFSDLGVPVVLLMENYDISRAGYHDTHDTMKNIDLDYGAALAAIAIEAVADAATSR